jgi:hypothetical protein
MFFQAAFVTLAILLVVSNGKPTISLNEQPERCCAPNKFSCQMSTSTGMQLPDGKLYESFVSHLNKRDFDLLLSSRLITIFHLIRIKQW